ncbi:hypothetical protein PFISCL1PPCAC_8835, partial [Pristionchus fissidentatus]
VSLMTLIAILLALVPLCLALLGCIKKKKLFVPPPREDTVNDCDCGRAYDHPYVICPDNKTQWADSDYETEFKKERWRIGETAMKERGRRRPLKLPPIDLEKADNVPRKEEAVPDDKPM